MPTIHIKGAAARNWFAERLVEEHGEKARGHCCGPMLDAVNAILEQHQQATPPPQPAEEER